MTVKVNMINADEYTNTSRTPKRITITIANIRNIDMYMKVACLYARFYLLWTLQNQYIS